MIDSWTISHHECVDERAVGLFRETGGSQTVIPAGTVGSSGHPSCGHSSGLSGIRHGVYSPACASCALQIQVIICSFPSLSRVGHEVQLLGNDAFGGKD